jgi:hypothetical protein
VKVIQSPNHGSAWGEHSERRGGRMDESLLEEPQTEEADIKTK